MGCEFTADDYGIAEEINRGIVELGRQKIISKISVMPGDYVVSPGRHITQNIQTGLHVTLAAGFEKNDCKDASPIRLFYLCHIKREITREDLVESILRQAEFVESRGIGISYLDAHLHLHVMPKLLMALIIVAKRKGIPRIRCITMNNRFLPFYFTSLIRYGFIMQVPKLIVLYALGIIMKRSLDKHKIHYAENLVLMPLAIHGDYAGLLKSVCRRFNDADAEIVTHPGLLQDAGFDEYVEGRKIEYDALHAFART